MFIETTNTQTPHFTATWPRHLKPPPESTLSKVRRVFWNFLSIIIFPIGLYRVAFWAGRDLGLRFGIIPGPFVTPPNAGKDLLHFFKGQNIKLTSPDGIKLDGAFFPGANQKKAIIFSFGNGMNWETSGLFLLLLRSLGVSILMINPRGIAKSGGYRSEKDSALDVYTAYEFLIHRKKIDPSDIVQVGFSMGGAYGAEGAAIVQKKYPHKKLSAMNINSFSSLELEIDTLFSQSGWLGYLLKKGAKLVAYQMYPKKALDSLKGKVCVVSNPCDQIIGTPARMIQAMKKDARRKVTHIELSGDHTMSNFAHCRPFLQNESLAILEELRKMLHLKEDLDLTIVKQYQETVKKRINESGVHIPLRIEQVG